MYRKRGLGKAGIAKGVCGVEVTRWWSGRQLSGVLNKTALTGLVLSSPCLPGALECPFSCLSLSLLT